jgi:hypothetical protein
MSDKEQKVSTNCTRGPIINNPLDLIALANQKRSVYHVLWGVKPASIFLSMQFLGVVSMVTHGYLYEIVKTPPAPRKKWYKLTQFPTPTTP